MLSFFFLFLFREWFCCWRDCTPILFWRHKTHFWKKPISYKIPFLTKRPFLTKTHFWQKPISFYVHTSKYLRKYIYMYVMKSMDNNNKWLILQIDLPPLLQTSKKATVNQHQFLKFLVNYRQISLLF